MLLSVAVACYNSESTLERCLSSFDHADFSGRLEVLIVNDGSHDRTEEIADGFVKKNPEIFRLFNQKNGGHGAAVNTALENAQGRYFRIVDSDDWISHDGTKHLLDSMEKLEPDVFMDERCEHMADTGDYELIELPQFARDDRIIPFQEITGPEYDHNFSMHTLTAKTDMLKDHGMKLFEHSFYVDMQYILTVYLHARTCVLIKDNVYNYRLGTMGQSVNALNYVKNYLQHDKVLKDCIERYHRNQPDMSPERDTFIRRQIVLMAKTQYKIALIYNLDRRQGVSQARALSTFLNKKEKWLARATRNRVVCAYALHYFGVSYSRLQQLKAAVGRA